ncbi:MAG: hypothetical protein ACJ8DI_33415 [Ktedonobacteraceae bacterium]
MNCECRSRHISSAVEEHPSDRQAGDVRGIFIYRIVDGKIVEGLENADALYLT